MSTNPYEAPIYTGNPVVDYSSTGPSALAPRATRFVAALIDGVLMTVVIIPIQFLTGYVARAMDDQVGFVELLLMTLLGFGVNFAINGYLLITSGQTVGKMIFKIQIVDFQSSKLLPFVRVFLIRYLWILPFVFVAALIPGPWDDAAIDFIPIVDVLFIFGPAQRCIHDYLAGSKVVMFEPNRPRL